MSKYEEYIARLLKEAGFRLEREKTYQDLKMGLYRFDFFVYGKGIIEVDGQYHFHPIRGRRQLMHQQQNDRRKNQYCLANNIPLYRVPY